MWVPGEINQHGAGYRAVKICKEERQTEQMVIETERLFLREMCMEDFEALYAVLADPDIMKHYPYSFDEERVREWIERNVKRYKENGFGLWAVCLSGTGEMIGDCGLTLQNIEGEMLPEIGYHIRRDCQKKGYAKEAAAAVRDWAFEHTGYPALYSYCKYTNVPSYRTAEAIGMHFEKEYPDEANGKTHVSVIRREEWTGKPAKRTEETELTVLCLIHDGHRYLLQDRVSEDWKGYTLPGGHVEIGESIVDAVIREMKEETGLVIENPRLCGIKQFPLRDGEYRKGRYLVFLFEATQFSGKLESSDEGKMSWIATEDLDTVPLVDDFHELIEVMTDDRYSEFQYVVEKGDWKILKK